MLASFPGSTNGRYTRVYRHARREALRPRAALYCPKLSLFAEVSLKVTHRKPANGPTGPLVVPARTTTIASAMRVSHNPRLRLCSLSRDDNRRATAPCRGAARGCRRCDADRRSRGASSGRRRRRRRTEPNARISCSRFRSTSHSPPLSVGSLGGPSTVVSRSLGRWLKDCGPSADLGSKQKKSGGAAAKRTPPPHRVSRFSSPCWPPSRSPRTGVTPAFIGIPSARP